MGSALAIYLFSGFRVPCLGFGVPCLGFRMLSSVFKVSPSSATYTLTYLESYFIVGLDFRVLTAL